MATLEKAIEIAARSHAGTRDKQQQGNPYILHPLRVMMGVEGEETRIVAVLHDVVEDTHITLDDIRAEEFSENIVEALGLVTHEDDQSYLEYVIGCRKNEIARQVKLSDLQDNSNPSRLLLRPEKFTDDIARMQRYLLSSRFLTDEIDEAQYRQLMAHLA